MTIMHALRIIFLTLFFTGILSAQNQDPRFGLKWGMALSNQKVTGDNPFDETDYLPGIYFGFTFEYMRSGNFSLVSDLAYIQKWVKYSSNDNPGNVRFVINSMNAFLGIDLNAKFHVDLGHFSPYIMAGPRFDISLSKASPIANPSSRAVMFGLNSAVGVEYNFRNFSLGLEGQYQPDLTPFQGDITTETRVYNNSFQVLAVMKAFID